MKIKYAMVALILLVLCAIAFAVQRGRGGGGGGGYRSADNRKGVPVWDSNQNFPHDVFTFVRVRYSDYGGGYGRYRGGDWSTDYPDADLNFSLRLQQLTSMKVNPYPVILDLTDPGGPSTPLYTGDFYRACARRLNPGGILGLHIASPFAQQHRLLSTLNGLTSAFSIVRPYMVTVPLSGGPWMMACASNTLDPASLCASAVDTRLATRGITDLQFYNGSTHMAAMALPNFVRAAVLPSGARSR